MQIESRIPAVLRRFVEWSEQPMNGFQQMMCGAFMGLGMAFLLFQCYFG